MSVQRFENERWARDDQKISFRHRAALELIPHEAETLLDIGCGDGLLLSLVKERGIAARGLDISEKAVEKTQKKGLEAAVADITASLPFSDNSFDVVVLLDVLEHLYTPETLLKEAARVSKRWVIVSVPNFSSVAARLQVFAGAVPENNHPHKGHVYWFTYDVLKRIVERARLSMRMKCMNTVFENRFFGSIFRLLTQMFPGLFALSFVVRLEKEPN